MAFPYVRAQADWKDANAATGGGDTSTPLTATALDTIEAGIDSLSDILENADAKGDLLVASGADAWTRLAIGAANKVLAAGASSALSYAFIVDAMIDAAAAIAISKLAGYPSDATKFLKGDGSWGAAGTASLTAALPGSPANGDEIILVDSLSAPTYAWHLRYISAKSTNKWQFIGGAPATASVTADESTSSSSYVDLTTNGPDFVTPVAGDWLIIQTCQMLNMSAADRGVMSYKVGAGSSSDDWALAGHSVVGASFFFSASRESRQAAVAASTTIRSQYKVQNASTVHFKHRNIQALPIALGG